MSTVIKVESISKFYKLGLIGGGTLYGDLNRWWAKVRGKPDPLLKIGQADHGNQSGEYIWALRDVSFDVEQGEVIGIIGKNGSGKSTLLKIISHITAPTSGEIKIKGRIGALLEVGTGFHPELTGRENVYLNGAILGMTKFEVSKKFNEIVDFSGVAQFIDTPVKRYSSGMKVRLAFAVAAHLDPEILVIDEVLAVGDAEFQKKCLGKMGEVAREGRTVLFVSHNMAAIKHLCSRAVWLEHGTVNNDGLTNDVVDRYLKAILNKGEDKPKGISQTVYINRELGFTVEAVIPNLVASNSAKSLKVKIHGSTKDRIRHMGFAFTLSTSDGVMLTRVGWKTLRSTLENVQGEWSCSFYVKDITRYILGGEYFISVWINSSQLGTILKLENVCVVEIPISDVYNIGSDVSQYSNGPILLPITFEGI